MQVRFGSTSKNFSISSFHSSKSKNGDEIRFTAAASSTATLLSFWSGPGDCIDIDDVSIRASGCDTPTKAKILNCTASSVYSSDFLCMNVANGKLAARASKADKQISWASLHQGVGAFIRLNFAERTQINYMKYANRDSWGPHGQEANKLVTLQFSDGSAQNITLLPVDKGQDFDHVSQLHQRFPQMKTRDEKTFMCRPWAWST